MGSMIGLEVASNHPSRIVSLALLSSTSRRTFYDRAPALAAVPAALTLLTARGKKGRVRADHRFHFTKRHLASERSSGHTHRAYWTDEYWVTEIMLGGTRLFGGRGGPFNLKPSASLH